MIVTYNMLKGEDKHDYKVLNTAIIFITIIAWSLRKIEHQQVPCPKNADNLRG
jgi:hypothetical protein